MNKQMPSETIEYIEASKHCDKVARQLADQLLSRLNNTLFSTMIVDAVRYPRQLILEKAIQLLTEQV